MMAANLSELHQLAAFVAVTHPPRSTTDTVKKHPTLKNPRENRASKWACWLTKFVEYKRNRQLQGSNLRGLPHGISSPTP